MAWAGDLGRLHPFSAGGSAALETWSCNLEPMKKGVATGIQAKI